MCHGLATELHLNLQIKVIAGCDKDPLLRQLFIRHNKTCKFSYGEMREMIRDILNDPSKIEELKNVDIMSFTCPCQGRSVLRFENNNLPVGAKYKEDELFLLQLDLIELLQPRKRNIT